MTLAARSWRALYLDDITLALIFIHGRERSIQEKKESIMNPSLKTSLAVSAAALFLAACSKSGDTEGAKSAEAASASADIKCMGINECKGQGACGVPGGHSCAGQNECKGKGWVEASEVDCTSKGGKVM